jgi:transposase
MINLQFGTKAPCSLFVLSEGDHYLATQWHSLRAWWEITVALFDRIDYKDGTRYVRQLEKACREAPKTLG